jgi:hypothetical protein
LCKCIKGRIYCNPECPETKESCEAKTSHEFKYTYSKLPNQCCGTCVKSKSKHFSNFSILFFPC